MKRWASDVPSRGMAVGTQLVAGVLLIPFIPLCAARRRPGRAHRRAACWRSDWSAARWPTCCISASSPTSAPRGALTVTYLIPVFGVLWGALFLGEALTLPMLAGGVLVILGTVLVLRT